MQESLPEKSDGRTRKLCTARAPWQNLSTRFSDYKKHSNCIWVGDLRNVLELNEEELTVTVEPLVEVGAITRWLVPRGYMLAATLEIEEATIGGLAMAVGMTTHSHHCGLLSETVLNYEIVTGHGELINATRDGSHADLYHALPWSHGSLGLLVSLRLRVIKVESYVRVTYNFHMSMGSYCDNIRALAHSNAVFVEATVFGPEEAVVMRGMSLSFQ